MWRSETYAAIANQPGFDQLCERRKKGLTKCLTTILEILEPRADTRRLQTSVRSMIIEPAFALAHKMHLSVDQFSIEWSQFHNLQTDQRTYFKAEDMNEFEFVDLASHRTLKNHPSGDIIYIFDITPKLVFQKVKADSYGEPKVLKKQKILVTVDKDAAVYSESQPTVLGWLKRFINE
jgi:hypothetical protein